MKYVVYLNGMLQTENHDYTMNQGRPTFKETVYDGEIVSIFCYDQSCVDDAGVLFERRDYDCQDTYEYEPLKVRTRKVTKF